MPAHRSWEFVDIERAAVRGVRQGIPLVTVGSWTMVLRLPRRMARLTVDSACYRELLDNGVAFAVKNVSCTQDSYSSGPKGATVNSLILSRSEK